MNVKISTIDNGVRVVTAAMPGIESVTQGIWVGVGSRYESSRHAGISHFIEHLLFKGTGKRSAREIAMAVEGGGGYLNAFTSEELTCYYARVTSDNIWKGLDVLTDMYNDPKLDPVEIKKECGVIVEEIMMYRDQPQHMVMENLMSALWKGHPAGMPVSGTPESLSVMGREMILAYKSSFYVPANTLLSFAGKVDHDECVKMVKGLLGSAKKTVRPKFKAVTKATGQTAMVIKQSDIEQSHMAMGFRIFGRKDKRRYALKVLNVMLGENMSSRLFQMIREKHGLAYAISSNVQMFDDTGIVIISAGLDKTRTVKALELIVEELRKISAKSVGAQELRRAKDYVIGQIKLGLESTTNQMMWVGECVMSQGRYISPEEVVLEIEKVSVEDILKLANYIFNPSTCSVSVISPTVTEKDAPALSAILERLSK